MTAPDWLYENDGKDGYQPAGPWSRFFARQIDGVVFGYSAWIVIGIIAPRNTDWSILENKIAVAVLSVVLALFVEIPFMAIFGWTVGKAFFAVRVRRADGTRLDFVEVAVRNMRLWVFGIGLGIPLVDIFFMLRSYATVKEGLPTIWDKEKNYNVLQKAIGPVRMSIGILTWVGLIVWASALQRFVYSL